MTVDSDTSAQDDTNAGTDAQTATPPDDQTTDQTTDTGSAGDDQAGAAGDNTNTDDKEAGEGSKDGDGSDEETTGAPEAYEEFTFPDEIPIDDQSITDFQDLARKWNLPQEGAQDFVDFEVARTARINERMSESVLEAVEQQQKDWVQAIKDDGEIGGKDHAKHVATANRAMDALGTPELKALMDPYHPETNPEGMGLGSHPEMVRFFHRVGTRITEGSPAAAQGGEKARKSDVDVFYSSDKE